jgi:protein-L-isoaspartate(D-aspartate) O-methyltransferase
MSKVERHLFVDPALQNQAYSDNALPIGYGQTISQPYIVGVMTQSLGLKGGEKVLEIGTGSGYQAAILSEICGWVFTIERNNKLAQKTRKKLDELGYGKIALKVGDGTLGWLEFAPYDGIVVTAGAPVIPNKLLEQLKVGGRLIIPVGDKEAQKLKVLIKQKEGIEENEVCECAFVPLIGKQGWSE